MAQARHERSNTATAPPDPHSISLKVLRLSRPSLATQTPLPHTNFENELNVPPNASVAYPSADITETFPLTPLLTLPPAFGAAYVGEVFACTLCVNNELRIAQKGFTQEGGRSDEIGRSVENVEMRAELRMPSQPDGMEMELESDDEEVEDWTDLQPGRTLQRIVRHELKEEGPHVLAVTVTYTEKGAADGEGGVVEERVRTFRKLYQFVAQQLVAVRSKITAIKRRGESEGRRWIMEAQLENVGEASVVLENIGLNEADGITCNSSSAGAHGDAKSHEWTVLKPADMEQVMFVVEEKKSKESDDGKGVSLAQLVIDWRGAMGEKGGLTTGWLASKAR